ncbi:hypothetical protein CRD60_07550 [Bifidobacterium aemilianum]|uniref:Type I restriction modification DNA specificity domain-containing protein n=1 Tax=Bifidobacterium aemilianum TaxID=2493120 RepID=A0A366K7U7_9BIFI|nr:hypothetical protein CRD60_07550 [Bifidobacterium aemilianum]
MINSGLDNRGIKGRTDRPARVFPANTITVDFWGNAYYRDFAYKMATHNHVFSLAGSVIKNRLVGLYLESALSKLRSLFSYNNMATWNKLKALEISLPTVEHANSNHQYTVDDIDFQYMREYIAELEQECIAELEHSRIVELGVYLKAAGLEDYELTDEDREILFTSMISVSDENRVLESNRKNRQVRLKNFTLEDLFESSTGDIDLQQKDVNGKGCFLINSGLDNRGIKGRTDRPARVFPANTITVDFWGNAYYRDFAYKMATHNHVFSLAGSVIKNRLVGLYLESALSKLRSLFSYNNMATWNKLKALEISLPVTADNDIDFEYMKCYILAIEKLTIADAVRYKDKVITTMKQIVAA